MEPITLTVSEPLGGQSSNFLALKVFMDEVEEASGGKITFDVYTDATLHPFAEALSAINSGLTDITLYSAPLFAEELPTLLWSTGLGGPTFGASPQDMLAGSPAYMRTMLESEAITQNLADNGAMLLATWVSSPYTLLCNTPVRSLEEARGLLVRTSGEPFTSEVAALGMTHVAMPSSEVYESLQRGVIDCDLGAMANFINFGEWEVAKNWTALAASGSVGAGYMMSKQTWDSLPPAAQGIISDARAAIAVNYLKFAAETNKRFMEEAPGDQGVEFYEPSTDMTEAIEDVWQERIDGMADTAPDTMTDPQNEIDMMDRYFDDWVTMLDDELDIGQMSLIEAFETAPDVVDWDRYQELFSEFLEQAE